VTTAPAPVAPVATVVVVTWNAGELLRLALDGLAVQDLPAGTFEVVVVDNASVDGTAELVQEHYPWVRLVRNTTNLGFAGGNNSALRHVSTPFAVLLNNDAVPQPDWLRTLLAAFDDPDVGVATGKVLFMPRFLRVQVVTPGFSPGPHDSRELGVRIHDLRVDGTSVLGSVLWERSTYGWEGPTAGGTSGGWTWTRPDGEWLIPVPPVAPPRPRAPPGPPRPSAWM
jgi:glycosyltransferase involved in cell wall biosynthesis